MFCNTDLRITDAKWVAYMAVIIFMLPAFKYFKEKFSSANLRLAESHKLIASSNDFLLCNNGTILLSHSSSFGWLPALHYVDHQENRTYNGHDEDY